MSRSTHTVRPVGITIVGVLASLFGMLEVRTSFRHEFAGIITSDKTAFTCAAAVLGISYIASGLLILSMRKY